MRALSILSLAVVAVGCSSSARGAPAPWRRVVLVELYTSQGCSSCPPADTFVRELPRLGFGRDRVVPLTFHVDYWDHLGWKDPFSSTAFTDRQEWYARSNKLRSPDGSAGLDGLYTPQMIVDGAVQFSGQRRETAAQELSRAAERPPAFELAVRATVRGSTVDLSVEAPGAGSEQRARDWRLVAALVARDARTAIHRGENAGELVDEAAVVRALSERAPLPLPGSSARIQLSKPADLAWSGVDVVVFAQSEVTREIGAVRLIEGKDLR
jgi:hypothetical protein